MKPRIVREQIVAGKHTDFYGPTGRSESVGKAALVLYWPLDCPYTPEQVRAACERRGLELASVPKRGCPWSVRVALSLIEWNESLTPEFIGESKKSCTHGVYQDIGQYRRCLSCDATLSDRRHGERRRGERRERRVDRRIPEVGSLYACYHNERRRPNTNRRRAK